MRFDLLMRVKVQVIQGVALVEAHGVLEVAYAHHHGTGMVGALLMLGGDAQPVHVIRIIVAQLHGRTVAKATATLAEHGILARIVARKHRQQRRAVLHVAKIDPRHVR